jgi:hypothetical protein
MPGAGVPPAGVIVGAAVVPGGRVPGPAFGDDDG